MPRSWSALAAAMPEEPAPMTAAVGRVGMARSLTEGDACVKFGPPRVSGSRRA